MSRVSNQKSLTVGVVLAALLLLVGINVTASASGDEEGGVAPLSRSAVQSAPVTKLTARAATLRKGDAVRYAVPDLVANSFILELGGLPQGKYHATFDVYSSDDALGDGVCAFVRKIGSTTPLFDGVAWGSYSSNLVSFEGSALVSRTSGANGKVYLLCRGGGTLTTNPEADQVKSNITLVKVGKVVNSTATNLTP